MALVMLALVSAVPGLIAMVHLYTSLRSDMEALLPADSAAVRGVQTLRRRMEGTQHLGIIVRGKQPCPAAKFALALAQRLEVYQHDHPELIRSIRIDIAPERDFIRKRGLTYLPLDRLLEIRKELSDALVSRSPADQVFLAELNTQLRLLDPFPDRFLDDRLVSNDGRTALVLVFLATADTGVGTIGPMVERVRLEVAALNPEAGDLQVGYAGDVAIAVEELSALESDIGVSAGLVFVGVVCAVIVFFRWWGALLAIAIPLAVGATWGFGIASHFVESLCSSTAFLGSIVVGNGINPGIMLSARYNEGRRMGLAPRAAVDAARRGTWKGTLAAAVAASAGYASLLTTDFRGFNEFAVIGSVGMLTCWSATYLLLPHLLIILDQRGHQASARLSVADGHSAWMAAPSTKHSRMVLGCSVVVMGVCVLMITRFDQSHIEYDMSKLRNRDSAVSGEAYWSRQMDEVLGQNFTSVALMTDSIDDARVIGATLLAAASAGPLSAITSRIVTPDELLSPDRMKRREVLEDIAGLFPPGLVSALPPDLRELAESLSGLIEAEPLTAAHLPHLLALGLREKDGGYGRTVLLVQSLDGATWNGELTLQAAGELRDIAARVNPPADIAGGFFVSANVLESLHREAIPTTVTAFGAVTLIVLVLFRGRRHAFQVLAALLAGVTLLAGIVVAFGVKINFLNFMAFPITFGIGVEYAIYVLQRYREQPQHTRLIVGPTARAVALCSFTTILGYGSLLVASNQALFSFGVLAVLGEITCLVVAVLVLPAALNVWHRPRHPRVRHIAK